ncbi:hypothetical protein ACFYY8_36235 [Streptosporangium sp. NPDC001559]|uniref:hypothetical protein n=1 Tax=Streptosporangium sp. NPDC001559 TaxID=3366187 RepID=UPI0036EBB759
MDATGLRKPSEKPEESGEDAIPAVPFLVGSGMILLAVALLFRGTLRADLRAERNRRSRLERSRRRAVPQEERGPEPEPGSPA